ncbi:hypothetical protein DUNSADRAFT_554, partial [Dunaliella salina]
MAWDTSLQNFPLYMATWQHKEVSIGPPVFLSVVDLHFLKDWPFTKGGTGMRAPMVMLTYFWPPNFGETVLYTSPPFVGHHVFSLVT